MTILSGLFGFTGVAFGALGAHFLKERFSDSQLKSWNTATQYQILHSVAMLVLSLAAHRAPPELARQLSMAHNLFGAGIVGFSGSIYVLCLDGPKFPFGPMTPIGGLTLMAGWAVLARTGIILK